MQIENHALSFREHAQSKCGTLDYIDHIPGGGDKKVLTQSTSLQHYFYKILTKLKENFSQHSRNTHCHCGVAILNLLLHIPHLSLSCVINNNNNNKSTTMFMVLSSWQSHCESSPGSFDECRMAPSGRRPKTKPDDLGCEYACTGCHSLHPPSPFIIITQSESWHSFYRPPEGRRLSQPSWLVTYKTRLHLSG